MRLISHSYLDLKIMSDVFELGLEQAQISHTGATELNVGGRPPRATEDRLISQRLTDCPTGGWLAGWLAGQSVGRSVGRSVGPFAGRSVAHSLAQSKCSSESSIVLLHFGNSQNFVQLSPNAG